MFIIVIRTLYGLPKGEMDIFFWVGNHFLSIAIYFVPLIINRNYEKKLMRRGIEVNRLLFTFRGEEWDCLQKLFKGIYIFFFQFFFCSD